MQESKSKVLVNKAGERIEPADIRYDQFIDKLVINDDANNFITYDFRKDRIEFPSYRAFRYAAANLFYPVGKNRYAIYNGFKPVEQAYDNYRFYMFDLDKPVRKLLPFNYAATIIGKVSSDQFFRKGTSIRFFEPLYPVVYELSGDSLKPFYRISYAIGNTQFSSPDLEEIHMENNRKRLPVMKAIVKNERYFFLEFLQIMPGGIVSMTK